MSKCLTDNEYITVLIRLTVSVSHCNVLDQMLPYFIFCANSLLQSVVKARCHFFRVYKVLKLSLALCWSNQSKRSDLMTDEACLPSTINARPELNKKNNEKKRPNKGTTGPRRRPRWAGERRCELRAACLPACLLWSLRCNT